MQALNFPKYIQFLYLYELPEFVDEELDENEQQNAEQAEDDAECEQRRELKLNDKNNRS